MNRTLKIFATSEQYKLLQCDAFAQSRKAFDKGNQEQTNHPGALNWQTSSTRLLMQEYPALLSG